MDLAANDAATHRRADTAPDEPVRSASESGSEGSIAGTAEPALVDMLETFLAGTSHSPFDLAARELERSRYREPVLSATEIARSWDAVARYGDWLATHPDPDAQHGAALDWQLEQAVLGIGDFGAGAGPAGLSGVGQGAANLQVLRGLGEGFQSLRA